MQVHLTGNKGLVGSAINNIIPSKIYEKRINSLSDYEDFLKQNNIDTIIHTAAKVGGVFANLNNKIEFYLENSKLNNIVFEAAIKNNVKNFVNFSSTCVFPDKTEYPLKEEYIFNGEPHYTNDGYAYSKRMMQYLCGEAKKSNLNYFTLIPTNIFGPRDNYDLNNGHVLPALIHKTYLAKQNNTDLIVWGSGRPLREFVYSEDLAKITKLLIESNHEYDSIIISNSEEISIKNCVDCLVDLMQFKGNVIFDTTKPDGQFKKPTDISRLKSVLPNFKFTPFKKALEQSVNWFIENYNEVRK